MRLFTFAISFSLMVVIQAQAFAKNDSILGMQSIIDTQYLKLESKVLKRDFHLLVKLPASYQDCTNCQYPVVYLLDGGAVYPMLAGYYNYLRHEDVVPEVILVGISYGSNDFETGNFRSTDYTAPSSERSYWGGASQFQQALIKDILPTIEEKYPVDPQKRIIFGQSLAGQFVLYNALTQPELFYGHISSNPALHRNLEFFLKPNNSIHKTKLFVAKGSLDDARFRLPSDKWVKHWSNANTAPFTLETKMLDGYGHFSVITESFRHGLDWLLVKNAKDLKDSDSP
ncbi:alpha/beta hydrolase-fold protein [uncultured Paraglaciecola sp.]|uniref:alpha/beta hydrolase n=1 Tax=uncultured Paraglaciecola sp. TaxID=1765024 RepID=UPI002618925A|nr:alpha/beta hydrolase-fold protein [uncultured Paraglaciecola sp.]